MDADPHPTANPMGSLVRDQFQSHLDHYQELVELFNASSKKDLAALYESVDGHVKEALPDPIDPKRKENIRKMVKARLVVSLPFSTHNLTNACRLQSREMHQTSVDASMQVSCRLRSTSRGQMHLVISNDLSVVWHSNK
jgi:hypothetical protein